MKPFLPLDRVEFVMTNYCTGKCKHCSLGDRLKQGDAKGLQGEMAALALSEIAKEFSIQSIMTFGGEPLLCAEATCMIHKTATECGIQSRTIITNGYFSNQFERIRDVARELVWSGVTDVLLSVDAFHQEQIPLRFVRMFAEELIGQGFEGLALHPAWLVGDTDGNEYNQETHRILDSFRDLNIRVTSGNVIFPSGNAVAFLGEYFSEPDELDLTTPCGTAPYTTRLDCVGSISIEPTGDVVICDFVIGNIYTDHIMDILANYNPYKNKWTNALLEGGVQQLIQTYDKPLETTDCRTACAVCHKIARQLNPIVF